MAIGLFVEPGVVYSWRDFKKFKAPFSIALDGFVNAPTRRDHRGPYANYDHHSGVDRIATRSTSDQVHMEINLNLFDRFRKDGVPTTQIFVNDPDEDTCLASWELMHFEQIRGHANPKINRLVYVEDRLDCTAGAYPFGDITMRRKMAWIFDPYTRARFEGRLSGLNAQGMKTIMESVHARIDKYVIDDAQESVLEGEYKRVGGGKSWALVKENGPAARMSLYNDGINAFVSFFDNGNGTWRYMYGRRSAWVDFPILRLYPLLNKIDPCGISEGNRHAGSDTIGGSPRKTGSKISPQDLEKILNERLHLG
ncbi:hypothetical protein EXS74_00470 [Candidatus Woesearchaeota archaeon]|nr:hypothetical protein [Candidatus Woesearchaeota archaeon]